jgi:hypothetical protein
VPFYTLIDALGNALRESSVWPATIAIDMRPKNDHELAIAKAIDINLLDDPNSAFEIIVPVIAGSMGFLLSRSDTQFLLDYAKWRKIYPPESPATQH